MISGSLPTRVSNRRGLLPTGPPGLLRNFPHGAGHCEISRSLHFPKALIFLDIKRVGFCGKFLPRLGKPPVGTTRLLCDSEDKAKKGLGCGERIAQDLRKTWLLCPEGKRRPPKGERRGPPGTVALVLSKSGAFE